MFTSPLFLIAAAAGAVVPLILHLMQTRRRVTLPFPTLRFLKLAEKQSSRRIRMEKFLLWLLRTLVMALLGLAFAMPALRRRGFAWLGDAPRDVALVVDASFSMGYQTGRDTVWNKAVEAAAAVIEGLGENDRFCLYLARGQPEAVVAEPVGDKEQGVKRLRALEPGTGSSQLAPAVTAAMKALRKDERGRELELHILTDRQELPWTGFGGGDRGAAAAAWDPKVIGERTAVFVTLLGVPAPQNAGPADVVLRPAVVRPGAPARIGVSVTRTGAATETTATLFIDGEESMRRPLGAAAQDPAANGFTVPDLPVGIHPARIETPRDNLPLDDAFHFVIRVEEQLPTLCVGTPEDSLFLRTALRTGGGPRADSPEPVPPDRLAATPLDGYACVFLCNALPLTGQAIAAVEQFVRQGGLLVVFPGMRAAPDAYAAWTCLPGVPAAIEEVPATLRRRTLLWEQPRHQLLAPLRQAAGAPPLGVRRALVWEQLAPDAVQLASTGAGRPFLLERPFGAGRVLMFAVAADRTWSDFPLSPFYLPLVVQCVDYSTGLGAKAPYYWTTESLPLAGLLPEDPRGITLTGPDQRPRPLRSTVREGRTELVAEDLSQPGIYTFAAVDRAEPVNALAVNLRREESDLTPLAPETIAGRLGAASLYLADDALALARQVEEHRLGRSYGEHLLWAALILAIAEFFYANALLRKKPKLSEQLAVDASGQAHGHAG